MQPMDVTSAANSRISPAATPTIQDKRANLQAALLKKALEAQRQQSDQVSNAIEGKGNVIDIRI